MLLATGNSKLNQHWFKRLECLLLITRKPEGRRFWAWFRDSIISTRMQTPLLFLPYFTQYVGDSSPHSHKMAATDPGIRSSYHSYKQQGRGYDEAKENFVFF